MDTLVIDGVVIPVAYPGGLREEEPLEVGDRMETFDGGERSGVSARKRRLRVRTRPLSDAEMTQVRGAVEGIPPLAVVLRGDALNCSARVLGAEPVRAQGGIRDALDFELRER